MHQVLFVNSQSRERTITELRYPVYSLSSQQSSILGHTGLIPRRDLSYEVSGMYVGSKRQKVLSCIQIESSIDVPIG